MREPATNPSRRSRARRLRPARVTRLASFLALALLAAPFAASAAPPAGTPLDNTASGAGMDSLSGAPGTWFSNTVRAVVQPLELLFLTPDRNASALPGARVAFAHRLVNGSNFTADFQLDLANAIGDDFDLSALTITRDLDRDGVADAGEPVVPSGALVAIAAGDSADLIAEGVIPGGAAAFEVGRMTLRATGTLQGASAVVLDAATVSGSLTPPALAFYGDPGFSIPTTRAFVGDPLYLAASAPQCNTDPARRDTVSLDLVSQVTGDAETFLAIETGLATGVFRITPSLPTAALGPSLSGSVNGVLEVVRNDEIVATLIGCGASVTRARLWIEPAAGVFDARSGAAVAGARVELLDMTGAGNGGNPGGPARVFLADGLTPAPNDVTSDALGTFYFPALQPSTYRLRVTPPVTYRFPSQVPPAQLASSGLPVDAAGSYGADFGIADLNAPVRWGVPLDLAGVVSLSASKSASRAYAELGDEIEYTVRVESRSDSALAALTLHDRLPVGFRYVAGTARRDTARLADPAIVAGDQLTFVLGSFAPRASGSVRYRVRIGPGAQGGDGINRAWASADSVNSNVASARVQIVGGAFGDEAMISGTVFVDGNSDRRRGAGDPGMPGVRVVLDDGTYAITDAEGRYSLYGLEPRTHALRVDPSSLPRHVMLMAADRRDDGASGTRFVDLQRGELRRADFVVRGDSVAMIAARERARGATASEVARAPIGFGDGSGGLAPAGDPRSRPASGVIGEEGERRAVPFATPAPGSVSAPAAPAAIASANPAVMPGAASSPGATTVPPLEDLVPGLDETLGFLAPADGETLGVDQVAVRVKGALGPGFTLSVNGEEVSVARVGRRVSSPETGVEAWEYLGVRLQSGVNQLAVAQGSFASAALTVVVGGALDRLEIVAPEDAAAGGAPALVRIRALDDRGVRVGARRVVTLETSLGNWETADLMPNEPGVQVVIEGGEGAFALAAPVNPGVATLRASAMGRTSQARVAFAPRLTPLFAVGVLEGVVSWQSLVRGKSAGANPRTGFESEIEQFRSQRSDGKGSAAARGSMFIKGRVAHDALLTLGWASDKPEGLRRFRDVQPDAFYPAWGDASVRGYEAQSTGHLYARVDRGPASVLYGDFVTRGAGASSLSGYTRSLTGVQQLWDDRRVKVAAFTSRERSKRRVEELRGLGISGPYTLPGAPLIENSERVEVLVRDRDQPSVILETSARAPYTDYEIEPLSGRLTFKAPVPSFDAELNPVSIRVGYEVESGGEPFWVSGLESRVKLSDRLEVGGTYVDDHDPESPRELRGGFLGTKLGAGTELEAEWAATRTLGGVSGHGGRLELRHDARGVQSRLFAAVTDSSFDNPGAGFGSGRIESGGRLLLPFSPRDRFRAEALYSADVAGEQRRGGLLLSHDHSLSEHLRSELGLRAAGARERSRDTDPASVALRARLNAQLPRRPELSGYAEAEQNLLDSRRMLALGAEYRLRMLGRLYARHELASTLTGPYALNESQRRLATVFGVDADVARDQHVFGEYRLGNVVAGREAEAAIGLRNVWPAGNGIRIGTTFERVSPLEGPGDGATTALTGAIEFAEGVEWKGSHRIELRTARASDSFLGTTVFACRLDSAWTALGRNLMSVSDERQGRGAAREWLQVGFAYRQPRAEDWDVLGRYELRFDREAAPGEPRRRRLAHVVSLHGTGRLLDAFTASAAWAGKRVGERTDGIPSSSGLQRVAGRVTADFGASWDAGLHSSTLLGGAERRASIGAEIGRQMGGGVWLSAGWNHFGYEDRDFGDADWTRAGGYLRLRAKVDERLLQGLGMNRP